MFGSCASGSLTNVPRPSRGFAGPQWSAGGLREDSTLGESCVARFWRCFRKIRIEFRCVFPNICYSWFVLTRWNHQSWKVNQFESLAIDQWTQNFSCDWLFCCLLFKRFETTEYERWMLWTRARCSGQLSVETLRQILLAGIGEATGMQEPWGETGWFNGQR